MKKHKLSKNSEKNLEGINERHIQLIERSLIKSAHDFGIPRDGGLRTAKEQYRLYMKRNPRVTSLDGYKKESIHQSGDAFDVFVYDEHGACWKCIHKYEDISKVIKEEFELMKEEGIYNENEYIEWGGDWRKRDLPHYQIVKK